VFVFIVCACVYHYRPLLTEGNDDSDPFYTEQTCITCTRTSVVTGSTVPGSGFTCPTVAILGDVDTRCHDH
jgi:hypothetical protein